jgi:hypothetical protein
MFSNFNQEEIDLYEKIGKKIKIRKEIEKISENLEILKVKEDIESTSFENEKNKLIARRDILVEEEKDLSDSQEFSSMISKLDAIKNLKSRLKKLHEKKSQISTNIYEKLKNEYEEEYKKQELTILKELEKIKTLNIEVDNFLKNIEEKREEEQIRFNLQDYTEEEYNNAIELLNTNGKKAESIFYATVDIIEEFKNELQ